MDTIDKWLKSLRLHKYTHLFKSLTYHEMLNLDEKYLIEHNVTKGARNKMLVSVKKLNLRQDRLINMIDDLNQDNISMKEALTLLKDMLVTPIPSPLDNNISASSSNNSTGAGGRGGFMSSRLSVSSESSSSMSHLSDPYELTYLYIETLDKLAARLIESAGVEDNACHGIMAAILDECIKHNSFTKEQKAKVASYKQHFFKEQRAKVASFKQHFIREQKVKVASFEQQLRQQHHHHHHQQQQQQQQRPHSYNHNHYLQPQQLPLLQQKQQLQPQPQQPHKQQQEPLLEQQHHHHLGIHYNQPQLVQQRQPLYHQYDHNYGNLDYSSSHIKQQIYNQLPLRQQQQYQAAAAAAAAVAYREYSLLRPAITFELPCLRALVEKNSQV